MPLYEYQCDACGKRFEVIQKFSDAHTDVCRLCGKGPVQRQFSSPAIQFKGTGWYITDYAKKSGSDAGPSGGGGEKSEKGEKSGTSEGSEKKSGDTRTGETKTDSGSKADTSSKSDTPSSAASTSSTAPSTTPKA